MRDHTARPPTGRGLAARIVMLAAAFGLLGEVLIFVPAISRFRLVYLEERMAAARLAVLALEAAPDRRIALELEAKLLEAARARAITIWRDGAELMLGHMGPVRAVYDLRDYQPMALMLEAVSLLFDREPGLARIIAPAPFEAGAILDVALDQAPLRNEMLAYSERIANISVFFSALIAVLLVLSLQRMIVQPLAAITRRIDRFRLRPEDMADDQPSSRRLDEIGIVERELARMQQALRQALAQKARLAALGAAVSQLTHDLKNMLATAILISDRLEASADPAVRRVAPRLIDSLDRAIRLCIDTLGFARDQPVPPRLETFSLRRLVDEVAESAIPQASAGHEIVNAVPEAISLVADRDQLFRVLLNLFRNGIEAAAGSARIRCVAALRTGGVEIEVVDNGPGVPPEVQARMFESFGISAKRGGSGLGLAICREILRAHGGDIILAGTGAGGSRFLITLPPRCVDRASPASAIPEIV